MSSEQEEFKSGKPGSLYGRGDCWTDTVEGRASIDEVNELVLEHKDFINGLAYMGRKA